MDTALLWDFSLIFYDVLSLVGNIGTFLIQNWVAIVGVSFALAVGSVVVAWFI